MLQVSPGVVASLLMSHPVYYVTTGPGEAEQLGEAGSPVGGERQDSPGSSASHVGV